MISEFFINACILITFISLIHLFFKDIELPINNSLFVNSIIGIFSGFLGIILLLYSVHVAPNIIIDLRYIPLLLTAMYVGWFPTILSAIIIGGFRVLYFGVSQPAIIAMVNIFLVGIGFSIISNLKWSRKTKFLFSMIYMLSVTSVAFFIAMKHSETFLEITGVFWLANIVVAWVAFFYMEYLREFIKLYQNLKNEATKDYLTGLNNVRQFDDSFNNVSQMTLKNGKRLSLLFIDIDHFKRINDTYGHSIGDIILKRLGEILIDTFKIFDVVSRNGGEEFSVLLIDCSAQQAMKIAERLRKKVEAHKFVISDEVSLHIKISIGVSTYPDTTERIYMLLEDADCALYEAKRKGRGRVVLYENGNSTEDNQRRNGIFS